MVIDSISNAGRYAALGGRIAAALELLGKGGFEKQEAGKHEVDGASLYYLVQTYTTKPLDRTAWESHRKYLDIQFVVEGVERIGWALVASLAVTRPYDPAADAARYAGDGDFLTVGPGTFVLLWPEDAHLPCVAAGTASAVRKIVVKILL
jgi:biofilm protein TabA